ncbi:MAG: type II toxin-antitoxin system HicB family antitoxin [Angelakisella sp.]|nr:type II toxin-antitoxin system HicB family antitoxin [Angelakisella sp.]
MKQNCLKYKGYLTVIEFSAEDKLLFGKIEGIGDLVNFFGENASEIEQAFHQAVDDYLDFCREVGKEPEKPYRGSFNIRISPNLHRTAAIKARESGVSLNRFVETALMAAVEQHSL